MPVYFRYDPKFDALMIMFIAPEHETVVHYLDEYIALLFQPKTKEIVGFQVENFKHSFLPKHQGVRKVWEIKEDMTLEYFDELYLKFEDMKTKLAQAIFNVSASSLVEQGLQIKALQTSFAPKQLEPA